VLLAAAMIGMAGIVMLMMIGMQRRIAGELAYLPSYELRMQTALAQPKPRPQP
jgi:hypothetical protein